MRSTGEVNLMGKWRRANTGVQRYPRVATSVPIRISTVDPETDPTTGKLFFRSAEETIANLSRGGVYLRSWEPLEAGRRVIVAIELNSGKEIQLAGHVVWTRRQLRHDPAQDIEAPGYGVEFYATSNHELDGLDRLIDSVSPATQPKLAKDTSGPIPQP